MYRLTQELFANIFLHGDVKSYNTPQLLDQKVRDAKLIFRVVLSSILG
jgi:hypothetical protein